MGTIVDLSKLTEMQKNIYMLTGVRVSIYDSSYRLISFYPPPLQHTSVCRLIRSCADGFHRCNESDISGFKGAKDTKCVFSHKCHAGLTESVMPILYEGQIICYILLGQYLDSDYSRETQVEHILDNTKDYIDLSSYDDSVRNLPRLSAVQRDSAMSLMENIIIGQRLIRIDSDKTFEHIEKYIITHISDCDVNAELIAEYAKVPVARVRKCISDNTGMSVINYVTSLKIEKAQQLLCSTDLAVSEIAATVGFPDFNYFSRLFKKKVGTTPGSFRKNHVNDLAFQVSVYENNTELLNDFYRLQNK